MRHKTVAVGFVGVLAAAVMVAGCTPVAPKEMTEEDRAAVAQIAENYRRDPIIVAERMEAWNKSKDEAVAAFNKAAEAQVVQLKPAFESGGWKVLKQFLDERVVEATEYAVENDGGVEKVVHPVGAITLANVPLVVADKTMPTWDDSYLSWEDWNKHPHEMSYSRYVEAFGYPIFNDGEGREFSVDLLDFDPWPAPLVLPERVMVRGVVVATGVEFEVAIRTVGGKLRLDLEELYRVPGLLDVKSPAFDNGIPTLAAKRAAALSGVREQVSEWNKAKNAALAAYNDGIESQINPAKVRIIETAVRAGDWKTLEPFLEPQFAKEMEQGDWYATLKQHLGDQLQDPGVITLAYQRLEVGDVQIEEPRPETTIEEWCHIQLCLGYTYREFVDEHPLDFSNLVDVHDPDSEFPEPWVPPPPANYVTLSNPRGGVFSVYFDVKLDMLK